MSFFIGQGYTHFPKTYEPSQKSMCQKGDVKQVPYWETTNIRIISSTNFNAQFLFINNMFVTLLYSTCFEH